jgi:hypothetical protein
MNSGKQTPGSLAQQTLLIFVIAAVCLYAIGNLALAFGTRWIGPSALGPAELAQFIYPNLLSPKPLDRLVFLSVALSVVPVLALATFLVRFTGLALPAFRLPAGWGTHLEKFAHSLRAIRLTQWAAIGLIMIFAIYAGGYYRWFGADEVDYKFIAPGSFDAVIYSIMRISQGGTCLVDVMPQYGCYGEFFRPLWRFVPASVMAVTTVFFLLYLLAFFAAMRFAACVMRTPEMLLLCGVTLVASSSFYTFFDVDLQYWPLRTLFPCLALWLAPRWQSGAGSAKALALGIFSALAISWNLDSGFPVFLSLAILIALSGCTEFCSVRWLLSRERFAHLGIYSLGTAATLALMFGYLTLKAGTLADPGLYIHFQRIFYISGLMMLPIPPLPHPWGLVAVVILLALAALCIRVLRGRAERQYELIGFAAVLAIGTFVYYTGRSHIRVLELVSWLPIILAFCLADRMAGSAAAKSALRLTGVGGALVLIAAWLWFYGKGIDDRWAGQLGVAGNAAPLVEDARFIARETRPGDNVAIFAPNQGSLALTAGRTLQLKGPGITETLLWSEAGKTMKALHDHGPEHLFLDPRIRSSEPYRTVYAAFETEIRDAYVARDWQPNGRLLHLVRRQAKADRDSVPYERPLQVSGGRRDFPLSVAKSLVGPAFRLELKVIAAPQQERLSILASSTEMDSEPFQGMVLYHQLQMGQDHWVLALGDGKSWIVTPSFPIANSRVVTVEIVYSAPGIKIAVDGKTAFRSTSFATLSPTTDPLNIGDWIPHMFRADSPTDSPADTKYRSPNYWKIQDRRFNGEIISARLSP